MAGPSHTPGTGPTLTRTHLGPAQPSAGQPPPDQCPASNALRPTGREDVPVCAPNNSPDLMFLPAAAQPGAAWTRPHSDKTMQPLWLRGALHRHGLSQMDRWSLSDPHPQPVQGRPSQHTVPGSPIVNTGVPNIGAPVFTVQGPLQSPHGPFSGAERSPGMCMEQARPPGDRSAVALPTVRSQLLSKRGQTTTEDIFPEPAPVQWTHCLPTRMACSTASPSHTRGLPRDQEYSACPALAQGAVLKAELKGPQPHKPRAASSLPTPLMVPRTDGTRPPAQGTRDPPFRRAQDLGEGNGTPLQYSCLENPMDGGAW